MIEWRHGWFFQLDPDKTLRIEIRSPLGPGMGHSVVSSAAMPVGEWVPLFVGLGIPMTEDLVTQATTTPSPAAPATAPDDELARLDEADDLSDEELLDEDDDAPSPRRRAPIPPKPQKK